jgi:hypothetical protein
VEAAGMRAAACAFFPLGIAYHYPHQAMKMDTQDVIDIFGAGAFISAFCM